MNIIAKVKAYCGYRCLFCLFVFLIQCSLNPVIVNQEHIGQYYAFCTLDPLQEYQEVIVGRAIPETLPEDISNAVVSISSSNQAVIFSYIGDGVYQDTGKMLSIIPGETYTLSVRFSDGHVITGQTTLPGSFSIIQPVEGDTVLHFLDRQLDTLQLSKAKWTVSAGAKFYTLYLKIANDRIVTGPVDVCRTDAFLPELVPSDWQAEINGLEISASQLIIIARDSTTYLNPESRWFLPDNVDMTLSQKHQALLEWIASAETSSNSVNINGGIGRFNGYVAVECRIILKIFMEWP